MIFLCFSPLVAYDECIRFNLFCNHRIPLLNFAQIQLKNIKEIKSFKINEQSCIHIYTYTYGTTERKQENKTLFSVGRRIV